MDGHSGRLIDDDDVLILVHDIQRQVYRRNMFGGLMFLYVDHQFVARGKTAVQMKPLAIYKHAFFHFL